MIVIAFICLSCFSYTVQLRLGLYVGVGLATIKTFLMLYCYLNGYFSCNCILYPLIFTIKWVGLGLGGRLRGLKIEIAY